MLTVKRDCFWVKAKLQGAALIKAEGVVRDRSTDVTGRMSEVHRNKGTLTTQSSPAFERTSVGGIKHSDVRWDAVCTLQEDKDVHSVPEFKMREAALRYKFKVHRRDNSNGAESRHAIIIFSVWVGMHNCSNVAFKARCALDFDLLSSQIASTVSAHQKGNRSTRMKHGVTDQ